MMTTDSSYFEYDIVVFDGNLSVLKEGLNHYGKQGWDLHTLKDHYAIVSRWTYIEANK